MSNWRVRLSGLLGQMQEEIQNMDNAPQPGPSSALPANPHAPALNLLRGPHTSSGPTSRLMSTNLGLQTYPTSTNVLTELRHQFAPYENRRSVGPTGRRSFRPRIRDWSHVFSCLGGPAENCTPSEERKLTLRNMGLGDKVITTGLFSTRAEMQAALEQAFPQLIGIDMELLRQVGAGRSRGLIRISSEHPVPTAQCIPTMRVATVYIRPGRLIESASEEPISDEQHDPASRSAHQTSVENALTPPPIPSNGQEQQLHTEPGEIGLLITLEEFRQQLYLENQGVQYIFVRRSNFLEQLLGVYKGTNFDFKKKPKVEFEGEAGADLGALTKEFFWRGQLALTSEKLDGRVPLFEGGQDHLVPTTEARAKGLMKTVGRFLAHAIIHTGIGLVGLSETVVDYLVDITGDPTTLDLRIEDVPDDSIQQAVTNLLQTESCAALSPEMMASMQEAACSSNFNEKIDDTNKLFAIQQILYFQIIEKRKTQLDNIRLALRETGLLEFFSTRSYLLEGVFPRSKDVEYPAQIVAQKVYCNEDNAIVGFVREYILTLDSRQIKSLLSAWTGWPLLPDESLTITLDQEEEFIAHSCLSQINVPPNFTRAQVIENLHLLVEYGSVGFGST